MIMLMDFIAQLVGWAVILSSTAWVSLWLMWRIIGQVIKLLGYWPLFLRTMHRVAIDRHERRKKQ